MWLLALLWRWHCTSMELFINCSLRTRDCWLLALLHGDSRVMQSLFLLMLDNGSKVLLSRRLLAADWHVAWTLDEVYAQPLHLVKFK
jgi:hypothetical protein